MLRKIVQIDESKCNGCGLCIQACHEGALQLIDGKAKLILDSYCDGLGACLPDCPTDAIAIIEREADAFDEEAVKQHLANTTAAAKPVPSVCPGSKLGIIERKTDNHQQHRGQHYPSELRQWPCQLNLVPVNAPYFDQAHLLVAADCTAYAYANIHADFMHNRVTVIGCPKLDTTDYAAKLTAILQAHEVKSVTVLRMEVPCCGGIVNAVKTALMNSGKMIPWRIVIIGTDGEIRED